MSAASQEISAPIEDSPLDSDEAGTHKNTVHQLVEEVCNLMADAHDIREDALARGVQFHTLNVLIELGANNKPDEQSNMMQTALAASKKAHGQAAITEKQLRESVDTLVLLQKDIGHVRRLAQQQQINMQAMNPLTQIIRLNPGDGGEKVVNDFVAYALLCGIKLEKIQEITEKVGSETESVLPDIELEKEDEKWVAKKRMITDVLIGLAIGVSVFMVFF